MQAVDNFQVVTTDHSGTQLADLLNVRFAALLSSHSGPTAPAYAVENMEWVDTSTIPYTIKRLVAGGWVTQGHLDPEAQVYASAGLATKASTSALAAHVGHVGNPHSVTKGQVGLGNCENTADIDKPVSRAVQTELDLKANLASPAFTGTPMVPMAAIGTNTGQAASTAFVQQELAAVGMVEMLAAGNNLSDLASAEDARTNLGLGDSAPLDVGTTAGTVCAGDDPRLSASRDDTTARDNAAMTALLAQLSAGRATGPVPGGGLYTFKTDELTNSGATYDAPGDYYTNEGATTKITGITATADQEYSGYPASALVDGTANGWQSNTVANQSITLSWSAAKNVSRYDITPTSGFAVRAPQSWTVDVYKAGAWVTGVDSRSGQTTWANGVIKSFALAARQTGVTAIRFNLTGAQSGSTLYALSEIEVFDTADTNNMTLTSAAVSLGQVPAKASVYLLHKAVDALTLNTDIKVSASRGDGWAEATDLTTLCQFDADYKLLRASVDLSALGTGSSASWRVQTYNTKAQRVRAALLWAE